MDGQPGTFVDSALDARPRLLLAPDSVLRAEERHQLDPGGLEERIDGAAELSRGPRCLAHVPREDAGVVRDQPYAPPLHQVERIREQDFDTRSDGPVAGTLLAVRVFRWGGGTGHNGGDREQREPPGL